MMMHYSPYKLAEVFKTLSGLAPNRIDFGVGRAPGGDHAAIYALAEGRRQRFTEQYDKLEIILKLMNNQKQVNMSMIKSLQLLLIFHYQRLGY